MIIWFFKFYLYFGSGLLHSSCYRQPVQRPSMLVWHGPVTGGCRRVAQQRSWLAVTVAQTGGHLRRCTSSVQ